MRRAAPVRAGLARRALTWLAAAGVLAAGAALLPRASKGPRPEEHVSAAPIAIEEIRADRLELRAGPVRLLLLSPPKHDPTSEPDPTGG
jgi:hypothetical protein